MKIIVLTLTIAFITNYAFPQQKLTFQRSNPFPGGYNVLYKGAVKNGKANGYGKAYISNNEITDTLSPNLWVYEGYWKDNDFNGKGNLYKNYSGGDWYKGNFSNGMLHGEGETYSQYNQEIIKGLFVQWEYKGNPTGQKILDSLLLIYKPLLENATTAENAAQKLAKYIPQDFAKKTYLDLISEFANNNMQTTYFIIIEAPYYIKQEELIAQLSPQQKEALRAMAQKTVDNYKSKNTTSVASTATPTTVPKPTTRQERIDLFLQEQNLKENKTYVFKPEWSGDAKYYLLTYIDTKKNELHFVDMSKPGYERDKGFGVVKLNITDYLGKISLSETPMLANKQYYNCKVCNATGEEDFEITTTKEKELPQGYFDGIQTKSIRTTTTKTKRTCRTCQGLKMILK